jgi:hypothetical protein
MKNLILIISALLFFNISSAQKTDVIQYVDSLNVYYNHYSDQLRNYRLAVIAADELSSLEKYEKYTQGKKDLMEEFKAERLLEFTAIPNEKRGVSHSCTKGNSGGTKKCGTKCISVPKGFLKVAGTFTSSGSGVSENDNGACITLQKSGKGRNSGSASAEYKIDIAYVNLLLQKEARKLFGDITARHRQIYPNEHYY